MSPPPSTDPIDPAAGSPGVPILQAGGAPEAPDYLPISFLNALVYCPRRFYYEYAWGEMLVNEHVLEGRVRHQVADAGGTRTGETALTLRRVYVYSDRLRISGLLDVVEAPLTPQAALGASQPSDVPDPLTQDAALSSPLGDRHPNVMGLYPIEYKKGSRGGGGANDHVQLCAQALCLEERTGHSIAGGYIFSFGTMHRTWVAFSPDLRARTEAAIAQAFTLLCAGKLPPPLPIAQERKCRACSLEPLCLPREVRALNGRTGD